MPDVFDQVTTPASSASPSGKGDVFDQVAPDKPKEPSGFGEVLKGAGKEVLSFSRNLNKWASLGLSEPPKKDVETKKKYDELTTPSNKSQQMGATGVDIASAFVPIPGVEVLGAAKGAGMLAKAGRGMLKGAVDAGVRGIASSGTKEGAAESAAIGGAVGAAIPVLGKVLESAARSQYGKILHPAGKAAKEVTQAKLLPKPGEGIKGVGSLLDQGTKAIGTSKEALTEKFAKQTKLATDEMNRTYAQLGPQARVNLKPVIADIAKFVQDKAVLPNGTVSDQRLYNTGLSMIAKVVREAGNSGSWDKARPEDIRKFRQIIDQQLFKRNLTFNATTARDQIRQATRTSIQSAMHTQHPTTESVDSIVHFWKTAEELMGRSESADIGKFKMEHAIRAGGKAAIGGIVGEEVGRRKGGSVEGAIAGGIAGAALTTAFNSTAWRSVSAVTKNQIAKSLADGKLKTAADIATRATATVVAK